MEVSLEALSAIFLVSLVTTLGGLWIASRNPKWYSNDRLCALIALGTGLLLGVAFIEFLPFAFKSHDDGSILVISGLMFTLLVEKYVAPRLDFLEGHSCDHDHSKKHEAKNDKEHSPPHHFISHQAACSAVGCLIVCAFFDGLQMLAAFQFDDHTGWIVSVGLLFHVLPDGVLAAGIALAGGMSKRNATLVSWVTGVAILSGAIFSYLIGTWTSGLSVILPFASGVLIYVTLIHLLPTGSRHRYGYLLTLTGIGLFVGLHFLMGHTH